MMPVSLNPPDEETDVLEFLKEKQASSRNLLLASAGSEPLINAFNPEWQRGPIPTVRLSQRTRHNRPVGPAPHPSSR